jgi:hypothetical protein
MAKLSAMEESPIKHVIVYGGPKTGKTELVGKTSERLNLTWFDLERGVSTLFKLPNEWKSRIEVLQIPDTRSVPMGIETMLKVIKGGPVNICAVHGKVGCPICAKVEGAEITRICLNEMGPNDCLVVDSLTQLTNSAIANITRAKPDDYKLERDDWANLGKVMDMFLSHVQAASYNIICISHENAVQVVGAADGVEKLVPVAGSGNFSRNMAKYFDEVVYCEIKNKKHVFGSSTTYSPNKLTGGRSGFSLETSTEPKLLELWR